MPYTSVSQVIEYRISSYSFRGKYSFLDLEIQRSQCIRPKVTVHKGAETIQGRKLFKGGNYMRKYRICIFGIIWTYCKESLWIGIMPSWQNLGIIVENKMSETWSFRKNCDSGYQYIFELMSGSSRIQSVLIGIKYRNFCRTLVVVFYVLLFG